MAIKKYLLPEATDDHLLKISRILVVIISLAAVGISLIPGITILSLFLFYGTLRSSTLVPTLFILFRDSIPSWGIFWGVSLAIGFGLPLYLFGELKGNVPGPKKPV